MWLLPNKKQWNAWSLPSKLTAIGAYAGLVGLLLAFLGLSLSSLNERGSAITSAERPPPDLGVNLLLRIGGFQIQVVNLGPGPARQVTVSLKSWQIGAPGPDVMTEFPIRDLVPSDDYIFDIDIINVIGDEEYDTYRRAQPTCGYIVVRSITSLQPRAWAFFIPGQGDEAWKFFLNQDPWPVIAFEYPQNTPQGSPCVDHPSGVCDLVGQQLWGWRP